MDDLATRTLNAPALGAERFALVVYHGGRTRVAPLRPGRPVLVGRGEAAELQIEDETISRAHTRVELVGEEVWVEDLRSKNGTLVNGQPVTRVRVGPHDRIGVGAAIAFLHIIRPIAGAVAGVEAHEILVGALDELLRRARQAERKLALVLLEAGGELEPEAWFAGLASYTRPYDRLAAYGPRTAELLLWDTDARAAHALVQRILSDGDLGRGLRAGIAVFPDAASGGEALLEVARDASRAASASMPVASASATVPGEARALVASAAMERVFAMATQLARSMVPVLVTGETGTGKELVARHLHLQSDRRARPLVTVSCAAIPQSLIEAELFGHERGAYTGADRRAKGLFEEADGGTLFLDEIGELPLPAQAALLRVLETKRFARIGSAREIEVDVRVVAATHRDLEAMCDGSSFRWDLLFRINTVTLKIPPLRDRPEEILRLAERFLEQAASSGERRPRLRIAEEVAALLEQYPWPGNVRELRNAMERAVALADGPDLLIAHLPERVLEEGGAQTARARAALSAPRATAAPSASARGVLPARVRELLLGPRGPGASDFRSFIQRTEAALIASALHASGGNKAAASRAAAIPLRTLKERLHGEQAPPAEEAAELLAALEQVVPEAERLDFKQRIRRYELALIAWALEQSNGSRTAAAGLLRIPDRTLRDRLRSEG